MSNIRVHGEIFSVFNVADSLPLGQYAGRMYMHLDIIKKFLLALLQPVEKLFQNVSFKLCVCHTV